MSRAGRTALRRRAERQGVLVEYVGSDRRLRQVGDQTIEAVLAAMGSPIPGPPPPPSLRGAPLTMHPPGDVRRWGWQLQLYAARSPQSWGIGDTADLRRLGRWARAQGASVLAVNPLSAPLPLLPQQPSPFYPSSRQFGSPLYIAVAEVTGRPGDPAGRALNAAELIDRDAVHRLKMAALERVWMGFAGDPGFEAFRAAGGADLERFATFNVLAERFGAGWRGWPVRFRHPTSTAVRGAAVESADRVGFHAWLQWLLEAQLRRAACEIPLMHDLALGFDPDGAEAWANQDLLAPGVRLGAPPDAFNRDGQDWGLPAFDPARLHASGYAPLGAVLRAGLRHGGGIHIDHVLGMFRQWWIPDGLGPGEGAYVRQPTREMLDILAIESRRAGAAVVGEDLGTVAPGVRRELRARRILASKVLWFESRPPARWPRQAAAYASTHDLPTIAGTWTGSDLDDEVRAGHRPNPAGMRQMRQRLQRVAGVPAGAEVDEVIIGAYRALAASPSALVLASLDDAGAAPRRANMPGTVDSWPNWRIPLALELPQLTRTDLAERIAADMRQRRGKPARHPSA